MTITINGKQNTFEQELTVQELLEKTHVELQGYVTVQINDGVLEREDFDSTTIRGGDRVEFFYHMGGER